MGFFGYYENNEDVNDLINFRDIWNEVNVNFEFDVRFISTNLTINYTFYCYFHSFLSNINPSTERSEDHRAPPIIFLTLYFNTAELLF